MNGQENGVTSHLNGLHKSENKLVSMEIKMMVFSGWPMKILIKFMASGRSISILMMPYFLIQLSTSNYTILRSVIKSKTSQMLY